MVRSARDESRFHVDRYRESVRIFCRIDDGHFEQRGQVGDSEANQNVPRRSMTASLHIVGTQVKVYSITVINSWYAYIQIVSWTGVNAASKIKMSNSYCLVYDNRFCVSLAGRQNLLGHECSETHLVPFVSPSMGSFVR